jgi:class 3 adenylate cyclase
VTEDVHSNSGEDAPERDHDEAAYRGFLFADLRGYTAFVERHGDKAAADLLDAYRELVRAEVAHHKGAEIRTEGDSFYVVFGSARRAVACGLAIVEAADRHSRDNRDRPIRVGVGINAGETVQRAEGFVGTAVNLAARVCAQAREGEVLVTAAVRDALGASPDLQLVPRGTRRLKGIGRPVALFAVLRGAATPTRGMRVGPRPLAIAAVLVGVLIVGVALWAGLSGARQPAANAAPDLDASATPSESEAPTSSASASADPNAYPNAAEAALLATVGERIEPHCERADEDDRPVMLISPSGVVGGPTTVEDRTASHSGIACEVPGASAPDIFFLWATRQMFDFSSTGVPEALILSRAGRQDISRGDCTADAPAHERWQLGDVGGWLLCHDVTGDAVIEWSYDDSTIFGRAVRRDGDMAALLQWWIDEARLLRP